MKGKKKLSILLAASLVMCSAAVPAYAANAEQLLRGRHACNSIPFEIGGGSNNTKENGNTSETKENGNTSDEKQDSIVKDKNEGDINEAEGQTAGTIETTGAGEEQTATNSNVAPKAEKGEASKEEIASEQKNEAGEPRTNEAKDRNSRVMSNGDKNAKEEAVGLDKYETSGNAKSGLAKANLPDASNTPNTGDSEGIYASGLMLVLANLGLLVTALKRKTIKER